MCEDQKVGGQRVRLVLLATELQDAPNLGWIGKIGQGAQVDVAFRLCAALTAHEAAIP